MRVQRTDDKRIAAAFPGQLTDVQDDFKLTQIDLVQFDRLGRDRQMLIAAAAIDSVKLLSELDYLTVQVTKRWHRDQGRLNATLRVGDVVREIPQGASSLVGHPASSYGPVAGDGLFLGGSGPGDTLQAIDYRIRLPGDLGQSAGLHQLKLLANHFSYTRKFRWWRIDFHSDPFRIQVLVRRWDTQRNAR